MDFIELVAEPGSLENSRIWAPDIELYNGEDNIWQGSLAARYAKVSSCPGEPSKGGCGNIFYSRPGLLKSLCKFDGLSSFPHDQLVCEMEFAAWIVDGRFQDITVRSIDGGASWAGKSNTVSVAGLTAGPSDFQEFKITNISSKRLSVFYDCCPEAPFPEILYSISISRATGYYIFKLILPGIGLTFVTFLTFWMSPDIGERLGFVSTMILAMIAQEITATSYMPVCNFRLFYDYISIVSLMFGAVCVVETGVVLYLHHQVAENWTELFLPEWVIDRLALLAMRQKKDTMGKRVKLKRQMTGSNKTGSQKTPHAKLSNNSKAPKAAKGTKAEMHIRIKKQLYRQLFFLLDTDFDGHLDLDEIADFLETVGAEHSADHSKDNRGNSSSHSLSFAGGIRSEMFQNLIEFMELYDKNGDSLLEFDDFCKFCDSEFAAHDDIELIEKIVRGVVQVAERQKETRVAMWQQRALVVDQFSRCCFPVGYVIFLIWLYSMDNEDFQYLMENGSYQAFFLFVGMTPYCFAILVCLTSILVSFCLAFRRKRRVANADAFDAFGDISPVVPAADEMDEVPENEHPKSSNTPEPQTPGPGDDSSSFQREDSNGEAIPFSTEALESAFSSAKLPSQCRAKALEWCKENGLVDLRELGDVMGLFSESLSLKHLERRRLLKAMLHRRWISKDQFEKEVAVLDSAGQGAVVV
jgi:Ca2+-binding EF-hand superfamily protein